MHQMSEEMRKRFFCPLWLQTEVVSIYDITQKRTVGLLFFPPLGVNHVSDKSIILPASVSWLYEIVQAQNECIGSIRKIDHLFEMLKTGVFFQYRLFGALVEVVKVHPEFKRMMNVVFLCLLGDIKWWDTSIFITTATASPEHPRATEYCTHREHLSQHTCKVSF